MCSKCFDRIFSKEGSERKLYLLENIVNNPISLMITQEDLNRIPYNQLELIFDGYRSLIPKNNSNIITKDSNIR
jgi:hypothetical protein